MIVAVAFLVLFAVVFAVSRRKSRRVLEPDAARASALDELVALAVARGVGRRSSLGVEAVEAAITGSPEPEIVARVAELVKGVDVSFERAPQGGPVAEAKSRSSAAPSLTVRVSVRFEDGGVVEETRQLLEATVPSDVATELHRTGAARAFRTWQFPWAR